MELALSLGISPKRITGWEPEQVMTLERSEDGRIERIRVQTEAEWDEEQVDLLLAAASLRGEIGPHGIPMDEATSPFADPNDRNHGWHYVARFRIDHAQRAANLALKERAEAFPDEDQGSLLLRLERAEDGPLTTED